MLSVMFVIFLSGCSGTDVLNMASLDTSKSKKSGVVFDTKNSLKVDIYKTAKTSQGVPLKPTVVFVYGGSWRMGSRSQYAFVANALNKAGFDVLVPDYRLYPNAAYPSFIHDLEHFFVWLNDNAKQFDISTDKIVLMGHSAGAYNSAMYLLDDKYKKPLNIVSFIGLAGPYDFFLPSQDEKIKAVFTRNGAHHNSKDALPVNQYPKNRHALPQHAFIANGLDDELVVHKNIDSMGNHLSNLGVNVKRQKYKDVGHAELIADVNNVPFLNSKIKQDIIDYLNGISEN